jgi:tetratricopeptide (TPR) repeat protein
MEYFNEIPEGEKKGYIADFEKMVRSTDIKYHDVHIFEEFIDYYLENEEIELAKLTTEKALILFPYNTDFKILLAESVYLLKNYPRLKKLTNELLQAGRMDEVILALHGFALIKLGDLDKGIEFMFKAVDVLDPEDEQIDIYHRAIINFEQGEQFELAMGLIEKIMEKVKYQGNYLFLYYQLCEISDNLPRGEKQIESIIKENPFNKEAWYLLANIKRASDDLLGALDAIEYAIAIDDNFIPGIREKAEIYTDLEQYSEALTTFETLEEMGEDKEILLAQISHIHQKAGNLDLAENSLLDITEINNENSEAFFGIGLLRTIRGDVDGAITYIKKAMVLNPKYFLYPLQLADLFIDLKEYDKALPYIIKAGELSSDEPKTILLRARVFEAVESTQKAIDFIESEVKEMPCPSADLQAFLCRLYWDNQQKSKSIEAFLKGLQLTSDEFQHFLELYFPDLWNIQEFSDILELFDEEL